MSVWITLFLKEIVTSKNRLSWMTIVITSSYYFQKLVCFDFRREKWLRIPFHLYWHLISDSPENEQGFNNPWSSVSLKIPAYKEVSSCSNAAPCPVRVSPVGSPDFQKPVALSTRQKVATRSFLKVKAQKQKERGRAGLRRVGCDQELNSDASNSDASF